MQAYSLNQVKALLLAAANAILAAKDQLTRADQAIGDGDHGIGMARGFEAVKLKLQNEFDSLEQLFSQVGQALMLNIGGSSGAIFGTLFLFGGKALTSSQLDATGFAAFLESGLAAVRKRGNAKVGDKTMVDALEPAALAARAHATRALAECLYAAALAAEAGAEDTKNMIATLGRAKTLGERSRGHADPGALSMSILLRGMAEEARSTTFTKL